MKFVILAGGLGSRFIKEGYECPKPLIPFLGRPMIEVLIERLLAYGAESIHVGANARMQGLIDYLESLKKKGVPVVVCPVITDNSYCTLKAASEGIEGKFIAVTCDAVFPPDEFGQYVLAVEKSFSNVALMGLTRFVEDESPLYAHVSPDGEVIDYKYGGVPFEGDVIVSAGVYGLSDSIMKVVDEMELNPSSLSDFQRKLALDTPINVRSFEFSIAFDVDNTRDRIHAEKFLGSYL